jgi:hypothetical protein
LACWRPTPGRSSGAAARSTSRHAGGPGTCPRTTDKRFLDGSLASHNHGHNGRRRSGRTARNTRLRCLLQRRRSPGRPTDFIVKHQAKQTLQGWCPWCWRGSLLRSWPGRITLVVILPPSCPLEGNGAARDRPAGHLEGPRPAPPAMPPTRSKPCSTTLATPRPGPRPSTWTLPWSASSPSTRPRWRPQLASIRPHVLRLVQPIGCRWCGGSGRA